ncbi:MAG: MFS transporter [bacterium]|nr:MFS transporter [bacterium]
MILEDKKGKIRDYKLVGTPMEGLIGATVGFFIGFAAVSLFGPVAKEFKQLLNLNAFQAGMLVAIPMLTGSLLRIPFAAMVDSVGGRLPFLILLITAIIGMSGISFLLFNPTLVSYNLLLLLGALCGFGIATFSVGIAQTSYWFPQHKQGWALGVYAGLGNLAPGIFALVIPFILPTLGLAKTYLLWLAFLFTGTIVYSIIAKDAYYFQLVKQNIPSQEAIEIAKSKNQELFPTGALLKSLQISAKTLENWLLVWLYFISFGGFLALTAWFPTFYQELFSVNKQLAGVFTALFSIGASLIRVWGGGFSDKITGEKASLIAIVSILLGSLIITLLGGNIIFSLVGIIFLAFGMGLNNAAVFKIVPKVVPKAIGGAAGWVGGLGALGGFVIPPILGRIVDISGKSGYYLGFVVFVIMSILGLITIFYLSFRTKSLK